MTFTWQQIKDLATKANPHELVYMAAGYYAGAHYSKQIVAFVTKVLGG